MAGRGRKARKTIDEQISEIIDDISKYEEAVVTLKNKLDELQKQKREEEISKLYELIETKGITIEEAEFILNTYENNESNELNTNDTNY